MMQENMIDRARLDISIVTYWHPGTGRGMGLYLDSRVRRDRHNLPILPGRTVKGLLRDAVRQAESLGWVDRNSTDSLFGREGGDGRAGLEGAVRTSPARLPARVRQLIVDGVEALTDGLYQSVSCTAIDDTSGTARKKSLRAIEVVVPLDLEATLVGPAASNDRNVAWHEIIELSLPLLRSVGSHRNRGFGRIGRISLTRLNGAA